MYRIAIAGCGMVSDEWIKATIGRDDSVIVALVGGSDLEKVKAKAKEYSLVPSKYIEFVDRDLQIDYAAEMTRIQKEMKEILREEQETRDMLKKAFKGIGYEIE